MAKRLDYSSDKMENYAQKMLSLYCDAKYSKYVWNEKHDNFDFTCDSEKSALEVITVLPQNTIRVIEYEKALDRGKRPNVAMIKSAKVEGDGELRSYYGGSMDECKEDILEGIYKKNVKAIRREQMATWNRELCLCVVEGGLFNQKRELLFVTEKFPKWVFSKIFIITGDYVFIIDKGGIERINKQTMQRE